MNPTEWPVIWAGLLLFLFLFSGCWNQPDPADLSTLQTGIRLAEIGQHNEAITHFSEVLRNRSEKRRVNSTLLFDIHYWLGQSYGALGRYPEAIRYLETALDLVGKDPIDLEVRLILGQLYWYQGDQRAAVRYLLPILSDCTKQQLGAIAGFTGDAFQVVRLPTEHAPTVNMAELNQIFTADGSMLANAPRVGSENADDYSPAFSPNGRQVVFASYRLQNAELFLLEIDSGQLTQLTQTPEIDEYMPVFSPDGEQIAFVTERKVSSEARITVQLSGSTPSSATISIMELDGQNRRRLTQVRAVERSPAFSLDGQTIVFESVEQSSRTNDEEPDVEIYTISIDGQNRQQLTDNQFDDGAPSFSPDGEQIVFLSHLDGNYEICVMDRDGGNPRRLTHTPDGDYQPRFSPDGKQIVFISNQNNDYELFMMDSDGQNRRQLTNSIGVNLEPRFSPNGNQLVFTSDRQGYMRVYTMNLDQQVSKAALAQRLQLILR